MTGHRAPQPVDSKIVPPDPSITSAIGRHHTLATAVADIVDNSIDAGAERVLVRLLMDNARPAGLQVIDDGAGMDTAGIDDAMTYARKRGYEHDDLGHFGIGLKAASMSQANTLIVWSKRDGSPAVGRRLRRETIDTGPVVEEFSADDASSRLASADVDFPMTTGSIIEWHDVHTFLTSQTNDDQKAWLSRTLQDLLDHLGLVLHRILARGRLTVRVESYDLGVGLPGIRRTVQAIDPFGYRAMRRGDYPKDARLTVGESVGVARLHVWPPQDRSPGFAQGSRSELVSQGFYVYRRDRLLQAGGWNGLFSPHADLAYARVEVNLTPEMESHVSINPEKVGTAFDEEFREAFLTSRTADGTTLDAYHRDAKLHARIARQRSATPIRSAQPGEGVPDSVRDAFDTHTDPSDTFPIDVKWRPLPNGQVYRIDRELHALVLNARYRAAIAGAPGPDEEDAALSKTLLLLLLSEHLDGSGTGPRKKREDAAWQAILHAAILAQSRELDEQ